MSLFSTGFYFLHQSGIQVTQLNNIFQVWAQPSSWSATASRQANIAPRSHWFSQHLSISASPRGYWIHRMIPLSARRKCSEWKSHNLNVKTNFSRKKSLNLQPSLMVRSSPPEKVGHLAKVLWKRISTLCISPFSSFSRKSMDCSHLLSISSKSRSVKKKPKSLKNCTLRTNKWSLTKSIQFSKSLLFPANCRRSLLSLRKSVTHYWSTYSPNFTKQKNKVIDI